MSVGFIKGCVPPPPPLTVQEATYKSIRYQTEAQRIIETHKSWMGADIGALAIYDAAYNHRIIVASSGLVDLFTTATPIGVNTPGLQVLLETFRDGETYYTPDLKDLPDGRLKRGLVQGGQTRFVASPVNDKTGNLVGYVAFSLSGESALNADTIISLSAAAADEQTRLTGIF